MTPEIIDALNASLAAHLTVIEFYADLAACHDRLGLPKLAEHWRGEVADEGEHRDRLLKRLEFLDAEEVWTHDAPPEVDEDPLKAIERALAVEEAAASLERDGIVAARKAGDEGTADVFRKNLKASESSIYELKSWLDAAQLVTPANWLANWT